MNADEIVRALREMATYDCGYEEESDAAMAAIDLIESLQAQLARETKSANKWICTANEYRAKNERLRDTNTALESDLYNASMNLEHMTAQLAASRRRAQDARNELCQKCGRYREAHKGACDGCKWKEN